MLTKRRFKFSYLDLKILHILFSYPFPLSSYELRSLLWKTHPFSENSIKTALKTLYITSLIQIFHEKKSPYSVYKLSKNGEKIAPYIFPLNNIRIEENLVLLLSPDSVSQETQIPLTTLIKQKSFFTYITIEKKLYVIKKYPLRSPFAQEFIQKHLPRFPYITSIEEIFSIVPFPPAKFLEKIFKLFACDQEINIFYPSLISYIINSYKISDPLTRRKNKKTKKEVK